MKRIAYIVLMTLLIIPFTSNAETIDVQIKGVDDGTKTTKQRDYKEAVLFAKREAIERAGVKIKAITTVKDLVLNSDYIESKAEAVLLPGYNVIDVGYQKDETYLVILIGKVKTSTPDSDAREIAREGSFIKYTNGVVYDKNTGLEWYAGPDKNTTWNKAKLWVERLAVAGGGWRMPTIKELKTLHEQDVGTRNMTPLLKTTGSWVWSGKIKGSSSAWLFNFFNGKKYWGPRSSSKNGGRVFAVWSQR